MSTNVTSVSCNHCGGPLQVPETTRFVTCSYCGMRLEIHRSGNAVYSEVLAAIDQRTAKMTDDLEAIRRQNEIERLDREWQMRRDSLMISGKNGRSDPSVIGGVFGLIVGTIGGVFVMAVAPGPVKLFGLVFLLVGVGTGLNSIVKASEMREAEYSYRRQRETLMRSDRNQP